MATRRPETKTVHKAIEDVVWNHENNDSFHLQKSEDDTNCYKRVNASHFKLRGRNYLKDNQKYSSASAAYELVCCKVFKTRHKMNNAAKEIESLRSFLADHTDNDYFIINWLVPGHYTVVQLYVRKLPVGEDKAFDKVLKKYREGDAKYRSSRFKLVPEVQEAPMAIKGLINTLLGGLRPVLIGNKLTCTHYTGKNYIEIDIDTGSSRIVSFAASSMVQAFSGITAFTGFLIEGREEDELPERMLAIHSLTKIAIGDVSIDYDYAPSGTTQTSAWSFFGRSRSQKINDVKAIKEKRPPQRAHSCLGKIASPRRSAK